MGITYCAIIIITKNLKLQYAFKSVIGCIQRLPGKIRDQQAARRGRRGLGLPGGRQGHWAPRRY